MKHLLSLRLGAVGAAAALIVGLTGCASETTQTTVKSEGPVQLDFWYSVGGSSADALLKQVNAFNTSNKHQITINAIYQGDYAATAAKLTNAVQSGDTPPLFQGGDTFTAYLHDSGLATIPASISPFDGGKFNRDSVATAAANYYTINSELWAVPMMVSQPAVFFNPAVLAQAGINPAERPKNIQELFDWADTIHEATGTPGLVFQHNEWWNEQFSASNGFAYCTPDNGLGTEPANAFDYVNNELVATWTHYQKSLKKGAILNVGSDGTAAQRAFSSQQAAMLLASSASLGTTAAAAKFTIDALPLPVASDKGGAVPGGSALWILGEGRQPSEQAAALEFAEFMGSADVQKEIFKDSGYLPSSKAALDELKGSETDPAKKALLEQLASTKDVKAAAGCHNGAFGQSRADVRSAIQSIADGADVRATLTTAQDKGTAALKAYNERVKR
ncbi:extracellular solute-binding protein [Paenarthrobacter sp. CM16]|nr:extracellular solute-binding protein [Paenarthrobacter sp. CM16]